MASTRKAQSQAPDVMSSPGNDKVRLNFHCMSDHTRKDTDLGCPISNTILGYSLPHAASQISNNLRWLLNDMVRIRFAICDPHIHWNPDSETRSTCNVDPQPLALTQYHQRNLHAERL